MAPYTTNFDIACQDCGNAVIALLACYLTQPLEAPTRTGEVWSPITDYDTKGLTALHVSNLSYVLACTHSHRHL